MKNGWFFFLGVITWFPNEARHVLYSCRKVWDRCKKCMEKMMKMNIGVHVMYLKLFDGWWDERGLFIFFCKRVVFSGI